MTTTWTPERDERLKTLWAQGNDAKAIAAMMGDASRNTIILRVHELGLKPNSSAARESLPSRTATLVAIERAKTVDDLKAIMAGWVKSGAVRTS